MRRIDLVRCVLLGVVPEARGTAINEALFVRAMRAGQTGGLRGSEAGWILEDNRPMRSALEAAGARLNKRYRLYESRV
jgi:hypothetical protein